MRCYEWELYTVAFFYQRRNKSIIIQLNNSLSNDTVHKFDNIISIWIISIMACQIINLFGSGTLSGKMLLVRIVRFRKVIKIGLVGLEPPKGAKNRRIHPLKLFSIILNPALKLESALVPFIYIHLIPITVKRT